MYEHYLLSLFIHSRSFVGKNHLALFLISLSVFKLLLGAFECSVIAILICWDTCTFTLSNSSNTLHSFKVLHLLSDNTTNWHHFTVTPNSCYCFCYLNSIFILLNTTAECQIQLSSGPAECTECTLQQILFGKTNSYPAILFQFLRLKDGNMWANFYLNIKTSIYLKLLQLQSEWYVRLVSEVVLSFDTLKSRDWLEKATILKVAEFFLTYT